MPKKRPRGRPGILNTLAIKKYFADCKSAPKTAEHFNVSTAAIHYHLKKDSSNVDNL